MIKAFMFDLDGTLIDENYRMSDKTIEALEKLKEKGYVMVANSGRPVFLSDYVTDATLGKGFFDYVYGNNGSEFFDIEKKEFELLRYLKPEEIHCLSRLYDDEMFVLGLYEPGAINRILVNRIPHEEELLSWIRARGLMIEKIDFEKVSKPYAKVICIHEKKNYEQSMTYIEEHKGDFFDAAHSSSFAIELVPKGVSKGSSVDHFYSRTGILPNEVIAFGDSANDVSMLLKVNGVLMGNANEENKKKVKTHTLSVKEDGIYHYLCKEGYIA